jgi:hypothetical protein
MPRKPIDNVQCASTIEAILDHVRQAEIQLIAAGRLFEKLPRALPTKHIDKVCDTANKLSALRMNILLDAHHAEWCDEDLTAHLTAIQQRFEKELAASRR